MDVTSRLTHEIFVPFEFGDDLSTEPLTDEDRRYLLEALPTLIDLRITANAPDLVAELVVCMRELRFTGVPAYTRGLQFLLEVQQPDGSWGSYEQYRARLNDLVETAYVLHTTMVTIDALVLAFHKPWNDDDTPWCLRDLQRQTQSR